MNQRISLAFLVLAAAVLSGGCGEDSAVVPATTGKIVGKVTDAVGGPIALAVVATTPATQSLLTDSSGSFTIANVTPGAYTVTVLKTGYSTGTAAINVAAGSTSRADIMLGGGAAGNHPPVAPFNPMPRDVAVDQPMSLVLRWDCSDPDNDDLQYDVYLGRTSPPSLVSTNQTDRMYEAHGLEAGVDYFWQVIARDERGAVASGPVWKFRTNAQEDNLPPEDLLVAHYELDGNGLDLGPNGLNGQVRGAEAATDRFGRIDAAMRFGGSASIAVPDDDRLVFANSDFTIGAWVAFDVQQQDYAGIVVKCTPIAPEYGYQMTIRNDAFLGGQIGTAVPEGSPYFDVVSFDPLSFGNWHYVAMVVARSTRSVILYIDGQRAGIVYSDRLIYSLAENEPLYIGRDRQGVRFFKGRIDDVRIYRSALNDKQIKALYLL